MYRCCLKRLLDFVIALFLLITFSPFIFVCFILILVDNRGDALFFQLRSGFKGKTFTIFKFKTMNDQMSVNGELLPDELRLTRIGKIFRSFSIDEILQLVNVLKGDMSLVGPRPLLPHYISLYTHEQFRRFEVKPGITGLAQVNGRNAMSWEDKFKFDIKYVDSISFRLDMKILWETIFQVLMCKGISSKEIATMEVFKGTAK